MSYRLLSAALLAVFAACTSENSDVRPPASSSSPPQQTAGQTGTIVEQSPATTTRSSAPAAKSVSITSVEGTNPLHVRGVARTFENAVSLRVRTSEIPIATAHTTATGEMGNFNPWEAEIFLTRMPASTALIVDAIDYSAKDGSIASIDSRQITLDAAPTELQLVFPLGDCTRFGPFRRAVPKTVSVARVAVEALVSGPTPEERGAGASSPFPSGSAVRSVILRDGVVTVDFNERLQNVGGSCAAAAIRESVTRTLSSLPNVQRVVITAGGSEKLALQP